MTRRMIVPLLFGLIGAAILIGLGIWQLQRLEWKQAVLAAADARIMEPAVALPVSPAAGTDKYLPVALRGRFTGEETRVLTSFRDSGPGFLLIGVFETADGRRVLVDRGYLPDAEKAVVRPARAAEVTGNLHWPDDVNSYTPPYDPKAQLWFGRDVAGMAALLKTEAVLVIARTDTGDGVLVLPVDTKTVKNDHLEYAITWFLLAAVWLGMTAYLLWRIRARTV